MYHPTHILHYIILYHDRMFYNKKAKYKKRIALYLMQF